jgi:hypothetical protein
VSGLKFVTYSHCAGDKALPPDILEEIADAIEAIAAKPKRRAATKIRAEFLGSLTGAGWPSKVTVAKGSDMTITSIKDSVGLCLQTGNMARMYADLMKLQTLYLDNAIKVAAIVVPSNPIAKLLGDNVAEAKRLERELQIFKKAYHVPTVVFGLE